MATKAKPDEEAYDVDESIDDGEEEAKTLDEARSVLYSIDRLKEEALAGKTFVEQRWVEDVRLYRGQYASDELTDFKEEKRSQAFVKLTRHKTNGWAARLYDLLFPTDGKNWGIQPTPLPKLAESAKLALEGVTESVEGANQAAADGNDGAAQVLKAQADAFSQKVRQTKEEIDEAKRRCSSMERAIEDQLVEAKYAAQCRDVIDDGCKLGTGILKGPLTSQRLRREWREEPLGHWKLTTLPDPMPEFRRIDPWHFFPDPSARTIEDAEYSFERHLVTKKDLRRMALKFGWSRPAVKRLIDDGPPQTLENIEQLISLRAMDGDSSDIKDRYVVWEYHGALDCEDVAILLRAAGKEEEAREYEEKEDPFEEYRVILYYCGNELLKVAPDYPLDSGETLYSVFTFEKSETSIWGYGVPYLMGDSQKSVNGAWRMMLDNAALSVGPQIVVDRSQIQPQEKGEWGLRPLKVWLRSSSALPSQTPPFEVHNIPNNQKELAGIVELGKMFIDEETSMPTIAQGEQGAASQTLGGMSILFNSANVVFRRVVKAWDDDLTTPTLRRAYDWNMQFNADDTIKGDMQVDARGTSVLLVREIQSQNLLNVVTNWSVHQVLGGWVKIRPAMEKALETMMVPADDILFTQEEYDENQAKIAEAAAANPPVDPNQIKLQIATETNQSRERVAQLENEAKILIAERTYDAVTAKIAQETGLSQQEIEQKYGLKREELASKERMKAVDIAVEDRRAKEAVAAGKDKVDAQGQGIG